MKKIFTLLITAALAAACNKLELISGSRSVDAAEKEIAQFSVSESDADRLIAIHRPGETYSVETVADNDTPLLYIYNFNDGWMVVSGDRRSTPILGESSYGNIDVNNANNGIITWLGLCADDIRHLRTTDMVTNEENVHIWDNVAPHHDESYQSLDSNEKKWVVKTDRITVTATNKAKIPHLIKTSWGQASPWNEKLPYDDKYHHKCYLGCTAVAFAQLLYYTHYQIGIPDQLHHNVDVNRASINGSTTDIGFSASDLTIGSKRWDEMALSSKSGGNIEYVQDLMTEVGNSFNTVYSGLGSGAAPSYEGIHKYGLQYSSGDYSYDAILDNLTRGMPVMITAYATKKRTGIWPFKSTSYSDGHCWLIDGIDQTIYSYSCISHCEYTSDWTEEDELFDSFEEISDKYGIASDGESFTVDGGHSANDYLLMNWGFCGVYSDAHFSISSDAVWTANGYNYQYKKTIYYDFL